MHTYILMLLYFTALKEAVILTATAQLQMPPFEGRCWRSLWWHNWEHSSLGMGLNRLGHPYGGPLLRDLSSYFISHWLLISLTMLLKDLMYCFTVVLILSSGSISENSVGWLFFSPLAVMLWGASGYHGMELKLLRALIGRFGAKGHQCTSNNWLMPRADDTQLCSSVTSESA